jgi:hypothetical protein
VCTFLPGEPFLVTMHTSGHDAHGTSSSVRRSATFRNLLVRLMRTGWEASFVVPSPVDQAAGRLAECVRPTSFVSLLTRTLVGRVSIDAVVVYRRWPYVVFRGVCRRQCPGSALEGRFVLPRVTRIVFAVMLMVPFLALCIPAVSLFDRTAPLASIAAMLLFHPWVGFSTADLLLFVGLARQDSECLSAAILRALNEDGQ